MEVRQDLFKKRYLYFQACLLLNSRHMVEQWQCFIIDDLLLCKSSSQVLLFVLGVHIKTI